MKKKNLIICGPTATGKTDLAVQLAKKFNGELISADSRQVYVGMDIGTGKYSPSDSFKKFQGRWLLNDVWIHGYDLVEPDKQFTVADFINFFEKTVSKIWQKGKLPILVGGTGFYIKAVLDGIDTLGIPADWQLREELEELPIEELQERLKILDPQKWEAMNESDRKNPRRLIRAMEIASSNQKSKIKKQKLISEKLVAIHSLIVGLYASREVLYKRIDKRLEERIKQGLIDEVKKLLDEIGEKRLYDFGLEYRFVSLFLLGKMTKQEMIDTLKSQIHQYAKRQLTWFKKDKRVLWLDITERNWKEKVEKKVRTWLNKKD